MKTGLLRLFSGAAVGLCLVAGAEAGLGRGAKEIVQFIHFISGSANHDGDLSKSNDTNVVYRTKTDWIVDKAHRLDHPVGIDTLTWWEKGRFQIVYDDLWDEAAGNWGDVLMSRIDRFCQEETTVYFLGRREFGVLNLESGAFALYKEGEVPEEYSDVLARMAAAPQEEESPRRRRRSRGTEPEEREDGRPRVFVVPESYRLPDRDE